MDAQTYANEFYLTVYGFLSVAILFMIPLVRLKAIRVKIRRKSTSIDTGKEILEILDQLIMDAESELEG